MIYQFTFENFRSYRSETTIDFVAKPIEEHQDSLLTSEYSNVKLLPVAAIYGPNGGGKSNVLYALAKLRELVIKPISQLNFMKNKNDELADHDNGDLISSKPYEQNEEFYCKLDDSSYGKPTKFSILYQIEAYKYKYEINSLNNYICEENLFLEDLQTNDFYSIFERDEDGIYLCDEIGQMDVDKINDSFVIDELDAKLHSKLLRKIIELFTSNTLNKNGAQLLFTSHDLTTMIGEVFRRDEIWFSAFNAFNESVLYSLVDFKKENGKKPRND